MAPEQVTGRHPVDHRTDIYAIGCLGYWLLTGKTVFSGCHALETIARHAWDSPPPPSQRTTTAIPPGLDMLLLECLEKEPDHRPPSAIDLAQQLEAIPVDEAWTSSRAKSWWQHHSPATPDDSKPTQTF
jgi:serine/threonine-protein kinase